MECLEGRALLSNLMVTSLDGTGTGPGTLRNAIAAANGAPGSTIQFGVNGTISLTSALPTLTANTTIIGPGGPGASKLVIDGGGSTSNFTMLSVAAGVTASISGLSLDDGVISSPAGTGIGGGGGAIFNSGTLTLSGCTLSGDMAIANPSGGAGGGVYNLGTLTVNNCAFVNDKATGPGGGGGIINFGTSTVSNSLFSNDSAPGYGVGGGIADYGSLTVTGSTFSQDSASRGGGIALGDNGTATVVGSTLSGDTSTKYGGGGFESYGTLTVSDSTISGNSGFINGGAIVNGGALTVKDSTISGNTGGGTGTGGIFNYPVMAASTTLDNTIVVGNTLSDHATKADLMGAVNVNSQDNLIGAESPATLTNGVNGNLVGVANPGLGPLANNGGPTLTIALLPGSPAINAGSSALALNPITNQPLATDQRGAGFPRNVGGQVDIGAFEYEPPMTLTISASATSARLHQPVTLTGTVTAPAGFAKPSGMVTFFYGPTVLGMATVNASGVATLPNVTTLPLGSDVIAAVYGNDPNYPPINTLAFTQTYVGDTLKDDFDGDGKADLVTYGLVPGTSLYGFQIKTSSSNFTQTVTWDNQGFGFGNAQSIPVVGDYFGDGKDAYAIWIPQPDGTMLFQAISSVNPAKALSIDFGLSTDLPVVGDVDGDGKDDFGAYGYFPGLGYRYDFLLSSRTSTASPFGFDVNQRLIFNNYGYGYGVAGSTPVVGDFDGAGHAGLGVYLPSGTSGVFAYTNLAIPNTPGFIVNPPATYYLNRTFGLATDTPMAVDSDGDGKADLALYGLDPKTGHYRYDVLTSSSGFDTTKAVYFDNGTYGFGYSATLPVMADFEGTGHADFAVFQPDGMGGASYVFYDVALGYAVPYDFAKPTDLPADAPSYVLARRVRGH